MVFYECHDCKYKTHLKGNYDQHLNTKNINKEL